MGVRSKPEGGRSEAYHLRPPREDTLMAGMMKATIERHGDGSLDVMPEPCAIEDPHRADRPRCYTIMFDGERRACPLWIATTMPANDTHRIDPSSIGANMVARGTMYAPCGVLCQAARRRAGHGC